MPGDWCRNQVQRSESSVAHAVAVPKRRHLKMFACVGCRTECKFTRDRNGAQKGETIFPVSISSIAMGRRHVDAAKRESETARNAPPMCRGHTGRYENGGGQRSQPVEAPA